MGRSAHGRTNRSATRGLHRSYFPSNTATSLRPTTCAITKSPELLGYHEIEPLRYRERFEMLERQLPRGPALWQHLHLMASVAELFDHPTHAGSLADASRSGRAGDDEQRVVELALWLDAEGRIERARWKATTCVGLIACAERACQLLEAGCPPAALDARRLAREVTGLHPNHRARAILVVRALNTALNSPTTGAQ